MDKKGEQSQRGGVPRKHRPKVLATMTQRTKNKVKNILFWTFILAMFLSGVYMLVETARAQLIRQAEGRTIIGGCDDSLWKRVYNPSRLIVHASCVSVTGTIVDATANEKEKRADGVRHEPDGDPHGWLKLDPGQEQYLNAGNTSNEGGNLVYEIPCMFKVTQADAKQACKGYRNKVKLAPVGSHVRITGSWVMDDNHAHWNEIHPVTSIEVLP